MNHGYDDEDEDGAWSLGELLCICNGDTDMRLSPQGSVVTGKQHPHLASQASWRVYLVEADT